jgi:hypothetical protein
VSQAPVALFVYNRPGHTRRTVEALAANTLAADTPLHVFSDAPKSEVARPAVEEVRSYIRTISGFRSVSILEREPTLGLARSIIDGVTNLCEQFGRVIVLEDDLIVSPHFLSYMNDALMRYEYEDQVMQVVGYMFPISLSLEQDAVFLPVTSSWGWGTWNRAWRHFDASGAGYQDLVNDQNLRRAFDLNGRYEFFKMLASQLRGETDSWAIRWYLSVFLMKGLVLYPREPLVENVGFDGSGVNCVASRIEAAKIDPHFCVTTMPSQIRLSDRYQDILEMFPRPQLSIKTMVNRVRRLVEEICNEKFG